jgi:hypothetical protein
MNKYSLKSGNVQQSGQQPFFGQRHVDNHPVRSPRMAVRFITLILCKLKIFTYLCTFI